MLTHCWLSDMMIIGPLFKWAPRAVVLLAIASIPASAQSGIAGTVRDLTGAVLPGVTVEASSPALIERTRSAVTDGQGQYRLIDLRPGTYAVTFTLAGFSGHRHEGLELPANFTAPLNATLSVGALAETVTVTGASPLVDVQTTARRQSVDQERLDSLPTARDFQSVGVTVPGVVMGWGADVGGSKSMLQGAVFAYGGRGTDQSLEVRLKPERPPAVHPHRLERRPPAQHAGVVGVQPRLVGIDHATAQHRERQRPAAHRSIGSRSGSFAGSSAASTSCDQSRRFQDGIGVSHSACGTNRDRSTSCM